MSTVSVIVWNIKFPNHVDKSPTYNLIDGPNQKSSSRQDADQSPQIARRPSGRHRVVCGKEIDLLSYITDDLCKPRRPM